MHILMISDVYFPRINGVSTSIQTFRRNLQEMGHQTTLIAPAYAPPNTKIKKKTLAAQLEHSDEGMIYRIPALTVIIDKEDKMMRRRPIRDLIPTLKKQAIDIVHIQTPFVAHYQGVQLANALDVPVITSYHTFFEEYFYNYIQWLPKRWLRYAARAFSRSQCAQVDALLVPSQPMADVLKDYGIHTPTHILPTGLELSLFERGNGANFRAQHQIATETPCISFAGRIALEKNIHFLLQMFAQLLTKLPNTLFIIAGEGPALPTLRKYSEQLNIQHAIKFVGYLDRQSALQSCYKAADVFVFASRTETQGLVLLEAMACGTPVVSTAVMGTKTIMRDGEGGLVAEETIEDFTNKVLYLLENPQEQKRMQRKARAYAQTWSQERMTERLIQHYRALCEAHPKSET
ncbi:MAG: glycosyltransferase [bacterium]